MTAFRALTLTVWSSGQVPLHTVGGVADPVARRGFPVEQRHRHHGQTATVGAMEAPIREAPRDGCEQRAALCVHFFFASRSSVPSSSLPHSPQSRVLLSAVSPGPATVALSDPFPSSSSGPAAARLTVAPSRMASCS